MMKTILVATDLSERSDRAVRRAIRIAADHGAVCHVLHVVDDDLPEGFAPRIRDEARMRLERFVDANRGEVEAVTHVAMGDPLEIIPAQANEVGAALVVLGLHRPRGILDYLRETTMERLVRLTRQPILLVRDPADHPYAQILAPVSYSAACATALKAARALAPNAALASFHAVYLPFAGLTGERPGGPMDRELTAEAEAVREKWCEAQGLDAELCAVTPITGSFHETLDAQIARVKPDLIVLGAHTRSGFAPYTIGSFAAEMVRKPPADLLLAHP